MTKETFSADLGKDLARSAKNVGGFIPPPPPTKAKRISKREMKDWKVTYDINIMLSYELVKAFDSFVHK